MHQRWGNFGVVATFKVFCVTQVFVATNNENDGLFQITGQLKFDVVLASRASCLTFN